MGENVIVIRDPKTFCFNIHWPKLADENLKHEIEFIIKNNESLAENKMKTMFMNTENSKTNEPNKFILNLSQRLGLRSSDKHVALQNLSIYYMWKNLKTLYTSNKFKIIAPTWIDELDLPDLPDYINKYSRLYRIYH